MGSEGKNVLGVHTETFYFVQFILDLQYLYSICFKGDLEEPRSWLQTSNHGRKNSREQCN